MDFREAWQFLDDLQFFKIKLGLDSMTAFLDSLGEPQKEVRFVHVAGTNGKGSVSMSLLTLLGRAGHRVGLYTSPHLSSVRERFRINDTFISEADFARLATRIRSILNGRQITYFEFTTALAFLWFAEQQVDLAILEVGMGGRLDATNVITPLVSIITNVTMDHEAYLGTTLTAVAFEKAGVIKSGVPVVSGVRGDEVLRVVEGRCQELNAPLILLGRDFDIVPEQGRRFAYRRHSDGRRVEELRCRMQGGYQQGNAALALACLELLEPHGFTMDDDTLRAGLLTVHWPGRLEAFCLAGPGCQPVPCPAGRADDPSLRRYLLDGAHNPDGVQSLKKALTEEFGYRRLILVWASMADKDMRKTLDIVSPLADRFIFTMPTSERSATPEQLQALLPPDKASEARLVRSVSAALDCARAEATPDDLILVAGSLYLVGAARRILLGELVDA